MQIKANNMDTKAKGEYKRALRQQTLENQRKKLLPTVSVMNLWRKKRNGKRDCNSLRLFTQLILRQKLLIWRRLQRLDKQNKIRIDMEISEGIFNNIENSGNPKKTPAQKKSSSQNKA